LFLKLKGAVGVDKLTLQLCLKRTLQIKPLYFPNKRQKQIQHNDSES
jgi:hypothetical protein